MTDYPYEANFLEPMPAWPVAASTVPFVDIPTLTEVYSQTTLYFKHLQDMIDSVNGGMTSRETLVLTALAESTNVYFNFTGAYPCTNLSDWEGTGNLDGYGWNVLACNQLFMPTGYSDSSMFIPLAINYTANTQYCQDTFGLTPDYDWALRYFGGFNIT